MDFNVRCNFCGMIKKSSDICASISVMKGKILQQINKIGFKGNYFSEDGEKATNLGIHHSFRDAETKGKVMIKITKKYILRNDTTVLKTSSKKIIDSWFIPGEFHDTSSGAIQYFISDVSAVDEIK